MIILSGSVLFYPPKHFEFEDSKLKVEAISTDKILVTAVAYAKGMEVINEDDTMLLGDNYFDMNPGVRKLKVLKGELKGLKVGSVYHIW